MKRRTFVFGMGAAAVGGSLLLGTGAYSETESTRDITIETAGDENAYLRLEYNDEIEFSCETDETLLWITNHLTSTITEITIEVVGETEDIGVEVIDVPNSLEIGEKGEIVAKLMCEGAGGKRDVNVDIEVTGDDLEVTAHRSNEITITCECPQETAERRNDGPDE